MYQNRISLTEKDILEKEFKMDTRGYRLKEVDQFLDEIIGDYESFNTIIKELLKEKEDLQTEILNLKQEIRRLSVEKEVTQPLEKEVTNIDLIRRVSNLEKAVFGREDE